MKGCFKFIEYGFLLLIGLSILGTALNGNRPQASRTTSSNISTVSETRQPPATPEDTPTEGPTSTPGPTNTPEPTDTPEPTMTPTPSPDEIKAMAIEVPYRDLFRNVEQYIGQTIHFEGEIIQSVEQTVWFGDDYRIFRIQLADGDVMWAEYHGQERFLEKDTVAIWGLVNGIEEYNSVLGGTVEIPSVTVRVIELISG